MTMRRGDPAFYLVTVVVSFALPGAPARGLGQQVPAANPASLPAPQPAQPLGPAATTPTGHPNATSPSLADAAGLFGAKIGMLSRDQIRAVVRQVAENDLANEKRQRDYTYTRREVEHKRNGKGEITSTESKTYEVMVLYGEPVERLIEKDGKPLAEKEAAKEEARISKLTEKRKNESDGDRQRRLQKEAKERDEDRAFVREVADAYDFRLAGIEKIDGRDTYVVDGEPHPGYEPHLKQAKFLPKFRLRVWIDQAEMQWVRFDAVAIDTVSWGLFIARVHKGSHVEAEQTRVNDEVWLPKHVAIGLDARVALLKDYNLDLDETYSAYRKFRTATRIIGMGQADEDHPR